MYNAVGMNYRFYDVPVNVYMLSTMKCFDSFFLFNVYFLYSLIYMYIFYIGLMHFAFQ